MTTRIHGNARTGFFTLHGDHYRYTAHIAEWDGEPCNVVEVVCSDGAELTIGEQAGTKTLVSWLIADLENAEREDRALVERALAIYRDPFFEDAVLGGVCTTGRTPRPYTRREVWLAAWSQAREERAARWAQDHWGE